MDKEKQAALVTQARAGDKQAFTTLYRLLVRPIYAYFLVRVSTKQDAEDLTTQTFMKALKGITSFAGNSSFTTWLYAIARNALIDFYRSRKNCFLLDEEKLIEETDKEPEIVLAEKKVRVDKLLAQLPEKYRQVLQLRFLQNLSVTETAQVLGVSESNVKVRQLRALEKARVLASKADERRQDG